MSLTHTLSIAGGARLLQHRIVEPAGWAREVMPPNLAGMGPGLCFVRLDRSMSVLVTLEQHGLSTWLHVSVARWDRYPSWDELHFVKRAFIGEEKEAVQILPRETDYVNAHKNCFHLWHRLDGDTVPGNPQRDG